MKNIPKWKDKTQGDLECEKLFYEIRQLKGKWWQPALVLSALPTFLAIISLIYVFNTGYFQASTIKLENEKHDIEAKIKTSQELKDKLEAEVKTFEEKKVQLEEENKHLLEKNAQSLQTQFQQTFIEKMKHNKRLKNKRKKLYR